MTIRTLLDELQYTHTFPIRMGVGYYALSVSSVMLIGTVHADFLSSKLAQVALLWFLAPVFALPLAARWCGFFNVDFSDIPSYEPMVIRLSFLLLGATQVIIVTYVIGSAVLH